ncbi:MAG: maltokinase [Actinomycetota bacterium]|jgi:maltokinase|nr:maltokinase [Actinomycetota bacterium]
MIEFLPGYLGRQRWFAGTEPASVEVVDRDEPAKGMTWLLVDAGESGRYSVYVAEADADEPPDFLHGQDAAVIGTGDDGTLYYDALLDPDLTKAFVGELVPGESPSFVRPMGAEQSNTSLVFDDRLVLKAFRRVHEGRNPDVEVTAALAAVGFEAVAAPVATWERDGTDLAVVQPYLGGGSDGWALALTSLRDMFGSECENPAECGGDFGAEARRLGEVTACMHVALAEGFGVEEGKRIRVHGDYHLGQVMRTDTGWYVLDFEGEPARPLEERRQPASPLKDVAGMLRSLHYASAVALRERPEEQREPLAPPAAAWEERNRNAFVEGYLAVEDVHRLLPDRLDQTLVELREWELDKARYELRYEQQYRPEWVDIPEAAIARLVGG